ncbi:MAG: DNA mismatch repair protein MutS [bacterium]|nr:DNA mismatch repair protein MutS [bacterium]
MNRSEVDKSKVAPMMSHYLSEREKLDDTILFYRLGDFYEMFFEDAILASKELELTLTGRQAGLKERIPMCGVPATSVNSYIERLVKKGYKVAICEQLEEAKNVKKGTVKRGITKIITSGTITSDGFLNEKENNYIGSIYSFGYCVAISYADITTGEIYAYTTPNNIDNIITDIISLNIKEVIANNKVDKKIINTLKQIYKISITITNELLTTCEYQHLIKDTEDEYIKTSIKHLLSYIIDTQKCSLKHMQQVIIYQQNNYLKMDINTKRNLELTESIRLKERSYTLLGILDFTKTAMGSRKLKNWIENPLLDKDIINKRYDIVDKLLNDFITCEEIRRLLDKVYDLERLSSKIALNNANAKDLLQLKNSLFHLPAIKEALTKINFYSTIEPLNELYDLLDNAIYESPPITLKEGYLIKYGYNEKLDELKLLRSGGKDFILQLENEEKQRTGIKNLKVGFNKVFGYYIEITNSFKNMIKEEYGYIRKQTLANCERYITPLLKEKENLILSAEEKIINLEYNLFIEVRNIASQYIKKLQSIAKVISEIDVLQSFATATEKYNYIRPIINNDNIIDITDARHPVVERVIKDEYVENDCYMNKDTIITLITGPNMSGKSTYMRQIGIMVIMAQAGCFIPATKASIPIFDKIFTRIGASDDLVSGESTFMVEMLEASNAIKNATKNSLILFDELGRGTATFDGMSLAQAILEYIHDIVGAKTFFSTHYHELTDLEHTLPHLINKYVKASEEDGNIIFSHKIENGSVDKSYGINVAKLAGLPDKVIKRASDILKIYESKEQKRDSIVQTTLPLDFSENDSEVEEKLKEIDILSITPIEAINILNELKELIK